MIPVSYTHLSINSNLYFCFAFGYFTWSTSPVSYTHLDVYKRQVDKCAKLHFCNFVFVIRFLSFPVICELFYFPLKFFYIYTFESFQCVCGCLQLLFQGSLCCFCLSLIHIFCPVNLTKAGLTYNAQTNNIEDRIRDWFVEAPVKGFLFPAFQDRAARCV